MSLVVPLKEIFADKTKLLANHESWERVELGNVCKILNGFPFKSALFNKSEGFPVIRIRDITRSSTETFYSGDVPPEYVVKKGDLLIGMDGNFRCCEWQGRDAGLNQRVCKITPDERILNRKFLLFGLNGYLKAIEDVTSSVTVGHLSSRDVQRIPFPLPPLAEQRRIVAKLETVLGKVDASQQRLAKIPVLLKRFRQSVLAAACSGRLTADWREKRTTDYTDDTDRDSDLPRSWKSVEFGELIGDGPQNGLYKPASFYGDGTLIVRIDAFYDGTIAAWGELKPVRLTKKERTQFALRNDDILVNRVNSPKFLGKCPLVRKLKEPCVYESNMMRLRLDTWRALPDYAILYLQSLPGLVELRKHAKHAVNQSSINQEDVKGALFSLPPLPEQQEIVRRVEGFFALADQLEERLARARGQVDALMPSLLAKAFRGQLVPQDPTDEPAEELLERIRATQTRTQ